MLRRGPDRSIHSPYRTGAALPTGSAMLAFSIAAVLDVACIMPGGVVLAARRALRFPIFPVIVTGIMVGRVGPLVVIGVMPGHVVPVIVIGVMPGRIASVVVGVRGIRPL